MKSWNRIFFKIFLLSILNPANSISSLYYLMMSTEVLRDHPEMLLNHKLKKTYKLLKLLGKGTFSVVYQCKISVYPGLNL